MFNSIHKSAPVGVARVPACVCLNACMLAACVRAHVCVATTLIETKAIRCSGDINDTTIYNKIN